MVVNVCRLSVCRFAGLPGLRAASGGCNRNVLRIRSDCFVSISKDHTLSDRFYPKVRIPNLNRYPFRASGFWGYRTLEFEGFVSSKSGGLRDQFYTTEGPKVNPQPQTSQPDPITLQLSALHPEPHSPIPTPFKSQP